MWDKIKELLKKIKRLMGDLEQWRVAINNNKKYDF